MTNNKPSSTRHAPKWLMVSTLLSVAAGGGIFIMQMTAGMADKAW
jgi:hypothetical protein